MLTEQKIRKKAILKNLKVERFAAEGKCVAYHEGQVVFVNQVVPGDFVDVRITRSRKQFLEAVPVHFHKNSPQRIDPFCSHFGVCGGCKWQHLDYKYQLQYKEQQVRDQLERIGKLQFLEIEPIIPVDQTTYYRNKLEFTFTNHRWLSREEIDQGKVLNRSGVGFHLPNHFDRVVDIEKCHLMPEPCNEIRLFVKSYAINNGLTFYDVKDHTGYLRNLIIRISSTAEIMVILQLGEDDSKANSALLEAIKSKFPEITSLYYVVNTKKNETFLDLQPVLHSGNAFITERMEDLQFRIGPKSFFQTNSHQALKLFRIAKEFAGLSGNEVVYDLYSGTGTIANFLVRSAKLVVGLEYLPEAVKDAAINSDINGITNAHFESGDIKDLLGDELFEKYGYPDVIITDPPRAGMHEKVVQAINESGAKKVVYISCNPATQARDLQWMDPYYEVIKVQPVDMFPHTHHVENIVLLHQRS